MMTGATERRAYWVAELAKLSGSFGDDSSKVIEELRAEIAVDGYAALLDHLHLCGAIPEQYGHDSSAEKLYAKYTDALISETLSAIGLRSMVINARGDSADVQARTDTYSLVADAKAFRLSRTAHRTRLRSHRLPNLPTANAHQPNLPAGNRSQRVHIELLASGSSRWPCNAPGIADGGGWSPRNTKDCLASPSQ